MPTLLNLTVMERDLAAALCVAESEDEAVRSTLSAVVSFLPGCGAAILYTRGDGNSVESDGLLESRARALVLSDDLVPSGKCSLILQLSDKRLLLGRFAVVAEDESSFSRIGGALDRAAALLSSVLRRISNARRLDFTAKDRELLVREMRHRTRNSLHLIKNSILFLLGTLSDLSPAVLEVIEERLAALVVVHDMLSWTESSERISAETYFLRLAEALRLLTPQGLGTLIAYYDARDDVYLPVDRAATIGLIVHELVMNSAKHAGGRLLKMSVRVDFFDGNLYFRYSETPVESFFGEARTPPMPKCYAPSFSGGSGLEIIRSLVVRARGRRLDDGSDMGSFVACFPID